MAKKANKVENEDLNIDSILFKCRDILRAAKNSGSFFEKRIIGTGSSTQKSEPMYLSPMILGK